MLLNIGVKELSLCDVKIFQTAINLTVYLFLATLSVFPFGDVAFREFTSHVMHEPAASLVGYQAVITLPTSLYIKIGLFAR